MAKILKGKDVVAAINEEVEEKVESLKANGISPCLAIVRMGENPDDMAYEKGAMTRAGKVGVAVKNIVLPNTASQEEILKVVENINEDKDIHGVLMLRSLPKHIDEELVRNRLSTEKDVDGITDLSMASVFSGGVGGFPPCTAEACIKILKYFNIEITGKKAVVVGRSQVIGKPVAMMLMKENATVTICHTKTKDLEDEIQKGDIVIAAAGRAKTVGGKSFRSGQLVIDVGINVDENGNLVGDVDFDVAEGVVEGITPVPGGVGTVTSSVLMEHVVVAAERTKR